MTRIISKFLIISAISVYLILLFLMPFQWYKLGYYGEIFPAIDIAIIYYFQTHNDVKYWHLFFIGILLDKLYNLPIGLSSLSFIVARYGLIFFSKWIFLKDYLTNITIFCIFTIFIILARYLIVTVKSTYHVDEIALLFYFLTTIFSYPIIFSLIEKPIKYLQKYVK